MQTEILSIVFIIRSQYCQYLKKKQNYTLKSFLLHFLSAKSLIKSSKSIWRNMSVSIMSRDTDSSLSCLIIVLFWYFIHIIWENGHSVVQFVTNNVKNIRKLISKFGKAHSMLSSTNTLFSMTESSFCCTNLIPNIWVKLLKLSR